MIIRDEKLFVRFDGYPTEDEERLESLDRLRFSSQPAEVWAGGGPARRVDVGRCRQGRRAGRSWVRKSHPCPPS